MAIVVAGLCLAIAINPVGFVGGGADDSRYLDAARCWAAHGPCLPQVHWWTRWPVVAPMAATIRLFGESRTSLALPFFVYSAGVVLLARWLGDRWFGTRAGTIAGLVVSFTPVIATAGLQPTAETPEIFFTLAAVALGALALRHGSIPAAILSGIALGVAASTRDTSLLFIPIVGATAFLWRRHFDWRLLLAAGAGFSGVLALEAVVYALAAGDPLWRWRLAMAHVSVPTTDLPAGFDTSQTPFFNPAYIKAWHQELGLRVAWPVDPWLNLLLSPRIGETLLLPGIGALLYWRTLSAQDRRALAWLLAIGLVDSALLIYGLAICPKSRMFWAWDIVSAISAGLILSRAIDQIKGGSPLFLLGIVLISESGWILLTVQTRDADRAVAAWIKRYPAQIETDDRTRAFLPLVPNARSLAPKGSGKPLRLLFAATSCERLAQTSVRDGKPMADIVDTVGYTPFRALDERFGSACLFRYR